MDKVILLDGGMGTMLQNAGLKPGEMPELYAFEHPEVIANVHRLYIEAGANIIYANTFGANRKKLKKCDKRVSEVITHAIQVAKSVYKEDTKVALDIGPIGELLEPNGYLSFEEAYDIFKEMIEAGVQAGADLVVFETMSDLMEVKAGVLAAKEHSSLPIFVTMSFEADHRTFTGCSVASFALTMQQLGVDAIGINCSLGPDEIYPIAQELRTYTSLPLIMKANAGLPDPFTNTYEMDASQFATKMKAFEALGITYMGGCCGTTPAFIEALNQADIRQGEVAYQPCGYVCTPTNVLKLDVPVVVGERINPTGNKRMKEALLKENMDEIVAIALEQVEAGAQMLDVNVGLAGIDEVKMMVKVVKALQEVIDVPLQIDSTNPEVIEAALRIYHGVAMVNSVNGEQKSLHTILPIVKKYGACVIGLTLDESGIQDGCQERVEIAHRIIDTAKQYGIEKHRVFIDALTLTVSTQQSACLETLAVLQQMKQEGIGCALGVSNISFGLPQRKVLNQYFFTMALQSGLILAIVNPNVDTMMDAMRSYRVLAGIDQNCEAYIAHYANQTTVTTKAVKSEMSIQEAIKKGLKEESRRLCEGLLQNLEPMVIVNEYLIPALDEVGNLFEAKQLYLPQLMNAASAAQSAFDAIKLHMQQKGQSNISKGRIILATVAGDVHDIGKNIVKTVLENYGYEIIDLGKDVAPEIIVQTAIAKDVHFIGLSALMTTTLQAMADTVRLLKESNHPCKIMVGGAVVSHEYAMSIGADYYAKDAKEGADFAKVVFGS